MRKPVQYVRTTIVEPFPVLYGHVNYRQGDGPFYAAGSEHLAVHSKRTFAAKLAAAEHLRREGYTVSVDVVSR